jgi:ferrochelatase
VSQSQTQTGVLLVNLGTPDAPQAAEVRRYLREFLSDPRVLDISPLGRWLLLNLIILPTRPARSAEAYRKIWRADGSPLLVHSRALAERVRAALPDLPVELAMRYGTPSIAAGLAALRDRGCDRIVVLPLYPQYAASSTGSTAEAVYRAAAALWNTPYITVVPPFYDHPGFIDAFAAVGAPVLADLQPDHVLYSFHGLPERHMHKSDMSGAHCLRSADCCAAIVAANRHCYRAQCHATARALTAAPRPRPVPHHDQLPVAARPGRVDPSVHRHRPARARRAGRQARRRVLPRVRRRLPGDPRGDRHPRRGRL